MKQKKRRININDANYKANLFISSIGKDYSIIIYRLGFEKMFMLSGSTQTIATEMNKTRK